MTPATPISQITSIGKRIAPALKKLGLSTAQDLLEYFPFRYEDWSSVKQIAEIIPGERVSIRGTIELIQNKRSRWHKHMVTEAIISDDTGKIRIVWFHQIFLTRTLKPGDEVYIAGIAEYKDHHLQFTHPIYERLTPSKNATTHTARIVPVYSLTARVTQKQLRYVISKTIHLSPHIREWLPPGLIKQYQLLPLSVALQEIHFPENTTTLGAAQHRLKFNELLLITLRAKMSRQYLARLSAAEITFNEPKIKQFVSGLPFTLTDAQRKAAWEIVRDLQKPQPMNRLLEGDVGSGKTIVSAIATLNVILARYQVAYMAPTEILATQQYHNLVSLFKPYGLSIALLTGNAVLTNDEHNARPNKKQLQSLITKGAVDLVVGTHAVIQKNVLFNRLALAIVDEQHRFGVDQRAALSRIHTDDSHTPHFLSMTATPIPRSLALAAYGDLDVSVIDELPPGRKPIKTEIIPPEKRSQFYAFIKEQVHSGRQVFVICPLIDPSDILGNKAATEEYNKLRNEIFPDLGIGLVHGKLKSKEKEKIMRAFADHELDILVATPVIEVGINIPNATVMMIESAERFGLAQLHQFRGRVGRGEHQSYCLLFTESTSRTTRDRLYALVESNDGFKLAEKDLEFRGPGEVYGVKQHGFDDRLKIAKLTDYVVIKQAQESVDLILHTSGDLSKFPLIKQRLNAFEHALHLE